MSQYYEDVIKCNMCGNKETRDEKGEFCIETEQEKIFFSIIFKDLSLMKKLIGDGGRHICYKCLMSPDGFRKSLLSAGFDVAITNPRRMGSSATKFAQLGFVHIGTDK